MPKFERFDLNGRAASTRETARRWRKFRRDVRRVTSSPAARVFLPLLGEDTRRRRLVEHLRPATARIAPPAPRDAAVFPLNYIASSPEFTLTREEVAEYVELVELDSSETDELVEKFGRALASTKEWVLVVHRDAGEFAHYAAAATLLSHHERADVVFGDETGDSVALPILKPPVVGPHTLWSYNVLGRPALLRRSTVIRSGGLRAEAGRAAEHDLFLRLAEDRAVFRHVPVVLAGRSLEERHHPDLAPDTQRVVAQALERRGITALVAPTSRPSVVRWSPIVESWPSVDIVIPTRDRLDLLAQCIASVETSSYPHFAITILDNGSVEPGTREYLARTPHRVVGCPGPFNYAALINRGVAHCRGDYVLTLNNDTTVRSVDWLEQLVGVASLDDVSVVGATLLDRGDVHEHDGIVIAPYPQHLRLGVNYLREDESLLARRDVSAVTGAAQLFSRRLFLELGGMDERLAVVMNDVDLCLRSQEQALHVVMVPDVVLTHFAGSTRGRLDPIEDRDRFVRRWDVFGTLRDPYLSESLRLLGATFHYRSTVPD